MPCNARIPTRLPLCPACWVTRPAWPASSRAASSRLANAYAVEELEGGESRTVLRLHASVAPIQVAVLPLSKKLAESAHALESGLRRHFNVFYDDAGNIGRRYRRQDEAGTPFCVTYDFDSLEDNAVTVRERDSMEQVRIPVADLLGYNSQTAFSRAFRRWHGTNPRAARRPPG